MTTLTAPARPDEDDDALRPVPWRRMAWVIWRQHRIALTGVVALLGVLAVWLWIEGLRVHHAWTAVAACRPVGSAACQDLVAAFNGTWYLMVNPAVLLLVVPGLTGAFAGGPVLGRELEAGTFRFAWTQGFDRWRWALAKLAALAVVLAGAGAAFGALVSWCYQPFSANNQALALGLYGKGGLDYNTPFALVFGLREVTFPAWTLVAFATGVLAGMLIRRVVPAIVTALAVYAGLAIAAAAFLREHYLTPLVTSTDVRGTAWIINQWWTKNGKFAFGGRIPDTIWNQFCPPGPLDAAKCLAPHGYTMWTSYQPDSRFWTFQWIEGGWLLALSVLLTAAAVWLVRRRAA